MFRRLPNPVTVGSVTLQSTLHQAFELRLIRLVLVRRLLLLNHLGLSMTATQSE
jgi:hypothetical protein